MIGPVVERHFDVLAQRGSSRDGSLTRLGAQPCRRILSRDAGQRIADAFEAIERCTRYVAALDGGGDTADMPEDAIERNLRIIGEAVNHPPEEITCAHPEIAWPQICGFRNILR